MSTTYQPLPTSEYPPHFTSSRSAPSQARFLPSLARRSQLVIVVKIISGTFLSLVVIHYVLLGALPASTYADRYGKILPTAHRPVDAEYAAATAAAQELLSQIDHNAGQPGTYFRDSFPIRSALAFLELAEKEVEARQLDTCNGQLGRELIEAYHSSDMDFCLPRGVAQFELLPIRNGSHSAHWDPSQPVPSTQILCSPVHHSAFSDWWPYPAAPCLSTNLRTIPDEQRRFRSIGCEPTRQGDDLSMEMGSERFLGSDLDRQGEVSQLAHCKERIERTVMIIGRQDQWNPFHVAEDLITTLVTMFIAARSQPALIQSRIQLVFVEGFGMDGNHFTPLWDRIGAWAPRRLELDPWDEGVCLTNAIHSTGAGASLLSAMGIGTPYSCASTITWASSHYYRHLYGLLPPTLALPENLLKSHHLSDRPRRPINVLWLSRAKLDKYALKHDDWSPWRDIRHIENEPDVIEGIRNGLRALCDSEFGTTGCEFEDVQDLPETWALTTPDTIESDEAPLPIRFAMLDPTVHAIETQIHFVGHTTVLISQHGGALGLALFLPPGDAAIIELQVPGVLGNFHFQHMAYEMGHQYEPLNIDKHVDVDQVWGSVSRAVHRIAQSG